MCWLPRLTLCKDRIYKFEYDKSVFELSYLSVPDIKWVMQRKCIKFKSIHTLLWSLICLQRQDVQTCNVGYIHRANKDYHWVYEYNGVYIFILVLLGNATSERYWVFSINSTRRFVTAYGRSRSRQSIVHTAPQTGQPKYYNIPKSKYHFVESQIEYFGLSISYFKQRHCKIRLLMTEVDSIHMHLYNKNTGRYYT